MRIAKYILPALATVVLASCGGSKSASGPKPFVGKISYSMTLGTPDGEENPMLAGMQGMMPSELVQASNGTDFAIKMDGMQAMHLVAKGEEKMMYIATQGQFLKQPMPESDTASTDDSEVSIEQLEETKDILGYTCKAYTINNGETKIKIYVTDEFELSPPEGMNIGTGGNGSAQMVPGTPLRTETVMNQGGMELLITLEAVAIEEGKEAAAALLVPSEGDYQLIEE